MVISESEFFWFVIIVILVSTLVFGIIGFVIYRVLKKVSDQNGQDTQYTNASNKQFYTHNINQGSSSNTNNGGEQPPILSVGVPVQQENEEQKMAAKNEGFYPEAKEKMIAKNEGFYPDAKEK